MCVCVCVREREKESVCVNTFPCIRFFEELLYFNFLFCLWLFCLHDFPMNVSLFSACLLVSSACMCLFCPPPTLVCVAFLFVVCMAFLSPVDSLPRLNYFVLPLSLVFSLSLTYIYIYIYNVCVCICISS